MGDVLRSVHHGERDVMRAVALRDDPCAALRRKALLACASQDLSARRIGRRRLVEGHVVYVEYAGNNHSPRRAQWIDVAVSRPLARVSERMG
jgi:hypothetical protein